MRKVVASLVDFIRNLMSSRMQKEALIPPWNGRFLNGASYEPLPGEKNAGFALAQMGIATGIDPEGMDRVWRWRLKELRSKSEREPLTEAEINEMERLERQLASSQLFRLTYLCSKAEKGQLTEAESRQLEQLERQSLSSLPLRLMYPQRRGGK